jgi:hypothetical protein
MLRFRIPRHPSVARAPRRRRSRSVTERSFMIEAIGVDVHRQRGRHRRCSGGPSNAEGALSAWAPAQAQPSASKKAPSVACGQVASQPVEGEARRCCCHHTCPKVSCLPCCGRVNSLRASDRPATCARGIAGGMRRARHRLTGAKRPNGACYRSGTLPPLLSSNGKEEETGL